MPKSYWVYKNGKTHRRVTDFSDGCRIVESARHGIFGNVAGRVISRYRKG